MSTTNTNYIAASSMRTFENKIAIHTNNISNAQTRGYKDFIPLIKDIGYEYEKGANNFTDNMAAQGIQYGMGSNIASTVRLLSSGQIVQSESPYDFAIRGKGYFQIQKNDGTIAYTRDGTFTLDKERRIVTTEGNLLIPEITVPQEVTDLTVKSNGEIFVKVDGQVELQQIGQLEIAVFTNENGLRAIGNNLLDQTDASGTAIIATPESDGYGSVVQYAYESSNTSTLKNIMDINSSSKIYGFLTKVIQQYGQMQNALTERV